MNNERSLPIVIIGGGGHASVLADILLSQDKSILAVVSPDSISKREVFKTAKHLTNDSDVFDFHREDILLVNGIGMMPNSSLRRKVHEFFSQSGYVFATVVSSDAVVSRFATLQQGTQVFPGAVVNAGARIGAQSVVNTGVIVEHDCTIGTHAHLCPGSRICGHVTVEDDVFVGSGSTIIQGITLSKGAIIAAGMTVVKDVDEYEKIIPNKTKK